MILDLEDLVGPDNKDVARRAVLDWPADHQAYVRINAVDTEWYADDLAAVAGSPGLRGVVLPKADDPAKIATTVATLPAGVSVLPLVEFGAGVSRPAAPRVDAWARSTSEDFDSEGESDVEATSSGHRGVEGYWPCGRRSSRRQRPRADWARTHCTDGVSWRILRGRPQ